MTLDFAQTLDRLQSQLTHRKSDQPIFVYTQPQNIHISVFSARGLLSLSARLTLVSTLHMPRGLNGWTRRSENHRIPEGPQSL